MTSPGHPFRGRLKRESLKIGLIIYGSLDTISGGYLYDRQLVQYLRAQGDEVDIISQPWSGYGQRLSHNLSRSLRRRLLHADFDLLLQDELNHPSLFWLNRRLRSYISYPIISIVHHLRSSEMHPSWLMPLYRWVERIYLRSVDGFVCNSKTTKRSVARMVGKKRLFSKESVLVASPAGDRFQPHITHEEIAARCQEPGPLRILFVGNLIPRKGLHFLLQALSQLPREEWLLDVVGGTAVSPAYTRRLQYQIGEAGLTRRVILHGEVSNEKLAHQYRRHHLLIVPSQYEGFGIVYLEAMGFGLPAIGTSMGAAGEIIQDGRNGYVIHQGNSAVFAQRIRYLSKNREELARLSWNARQTYLDWPGWAESMAKVRAFLHRAVCRGIYSEKTEEECVDS
jgi:glycosyltransferase involved in cell wall biosynthesis